MLLLNYDWTTKVKLPSHRLSFVLPPNHLVSWRFASVVTDTSALTSGVSAADVPTRRPRQPDDR
jgi:hypothetical protein